MNPRPPGYEPGELPDCSTPRRGRDCSTLVTLVSMWDWAIWGALIIGTLAGMAALGLLVARSLEAWRALNDSRRTVIRGVSDFAAKAEAAAEKLAAVDQTAELQESLARLRVSLARLAVLQHAIDEVDETVGRALAFVPHK